MVYILGKSSNKSETGRHSSTSEFKAKKIIPSRILFITKIKTPFTKDVSKLLESGINRLYIYD